MDKHSLAVAAVCLVTGPLSNPQLLPRDEASRRPDFLAFREALRTAVSRKDSKAVLSIVDPGVRIDFGGGGGIESFTDLMNDPEQHFWEEFGWALDHGGTFRTPTEFEAPYVYSAWPDEFDPFESLAVTGSRVRVRDAPHATARVLTHVDYAIVQRFANEPDPPGWTHVRLASGPVGYVGYVASTYVRSPIDYRAMFTFKDGRWRLTAFVAGD